MTDWTAPRTWTVDEIVTKPILDTHVRDNLLYLKEQSEIGGKVIGRQGGSPSAWDTYGTNNYTPSGVKIQTGVVNVPNSNIAAGSYFYGSVTVTFPVAFTNVPMVICSCQFAGTNVMKASASSPSTTQVTIFILTSVSVTGANMPVAWMAIGD